MGQTKVTATKGAEAGGASATGVPHRIRNAEMSQVDHSEAWQVIHLEYLKESTGAPGTAIGLPN